MIKRRDELFKAHRTVEESRVALMEPDSEIVERAQKESITDILAQLDEQEEAEIEAIDAALAKMDLGKYGFCEICRKPIAMKRLEALPWATLCSRHASVWERRRAMNVPVVLEIFSDYV